MAMNENDDRPEAPATPTASGRRGEDPSLDPAGRPMGPGAPAEPPVRSAEGAIATTTPLETLGLVLGVLGGTAVVFGVILYVIDPGVLALAVGNVVFGLVCLAFYGITHRSSLARAFAGRSTPLIGLEVVAALGVLGAAFAANWLAAKSPLEWDLTRDGIYTLHPQSVAVAERLDRPIRIYTFYRPNEATRGMIDSAVELYGMHTARLEVEHVNPDQAPAELLKRFDMNAKSARIVFVDPSTGRFTKIKRPTEEAMTNALIELAERRARKAYFLAGHGEPSIEDDGTPEGLSTAATLLGNEGLTVESLSLVGRSDLPEDASVVIVPGPRASLLPNEAEALKVFLDRGGRALLLFEPGSPHGLERVLRPFGVDLGDDLVLDDNPAARALGFGADAPVIQSYEPHPITNVMGKSYTLFFRARSVSPRLGLANITTTTLVKTSPSSWAETRYERAEPPTLDEDDLAGPVPIAVAVTKRTSAHPRRLSDEARLVVFGDAHFIDNRFAAMSGNNDLFVNSVNWLAGDEDRITIRPPQRTGDRLPLTQLQQYGIMFFSVNLLPLLIVGLGFSVWAVRRRK